MIHFLSFFYYNKLMPKKTTNASLPKKSCDFFFCPEKKISAFFLPPQNSQIRTTCKLGGHAQPRKIQFLPTSCWLNFSAPIFFVWLLHIFARTQTKETPSDLCTFDLAIGLFVFLGYFFFLFLLISPHCGYFFLLLSLGSWVFMVNFPSKWMLFCLHSNS